MIPIRTDLFLFVCLFCYALFRFLFVCLLLLPKIIKFNVNHTTADVVATEVVAIVAAVVTVDTVDVASGAGESIVRTASESVPSPDSAVYNKQKHCVMLIC